MIINIDEYKNIKRVIIEFNDSDEELEIENSENLDNSEKIQKKKKKNKENSKFNETEEKDYIDNTPLDFSDLSNSNKPISIEKPKMPEIPDCDNRKPKVSEELQKLEF